MKGPYVTPTLQVLHLLSEDVISTSMTEPYDINELPIIGG